MNEAATAAKKEYMKGYMREWRKKNRDKIRGYEERYWTKKAEEKEKAGTAESAVL